MDATSLWLGLAAFAGIVAALVWVFRPDRSARTRAEPSGLRSVAGFRGGEAHEPEDASEPAHRGGDLLKAIAAELEGFEGLEVGAVEPERYGVSVPVHMGAHERRLRLGFVGEPDHTWALFVEGPEQVGGRSPLPPGDASHVLLEALHVVLRGLDSVEDVRWTAFEAYDAGAPRWASRPTDASPDA